LPDGISIERTACDAHLDGIGEDREVYCHKSKLPRGVGYLVPGQRVEFELIASTTNRKERQARVTKIIDEATAEAA